MPEHNTVTDRNSSVRMRWWEVAIFSLAVGVLATFAHGYFYGDVDQQEQLPLIMRQLDPDFLKNDYMVNAMSEFSARIYYAPLMAFLSKAVSLPTLFLLLTCLQHILVVVVTFIACRKMFRSDAAAIVGSVMVISVFGPALGHASYLYASYLTPRTMMLFLALGSIWAGIESKPILTSVLAMLGSFIQPQVALLAGCLGFGVTGLSAVLQLDDSGPRTKQELIKKLLVVLAAFGAFAVFNYIFWYLPSKGGELSMESLHFITSSYWPGGLMPSKYPLSEYLLFACFVAATAMFWKWWYENDSTNKKLALRIALASAIVLACFVAGFVFSVIIPTRLFLSLQIFRLVFVIKWFGLMLLGGISADLLLRKRDEGRSFTPMFFLTAAGVLQPAILLIGVVVEQFRRMFAQKLSVTVYNSVFAVAILMQVAALIAVRGLKESLSVFVCLAVSIGFLYFRKPLARVALPVLAVVSLTGLIALSNAVQIPGVSKLLGKAEGKGISTDFHIDPAFDQVAAFAKQKTPKESVFLTPPDFGRFRLLAERAIMTDWRMVPFREKDVVEWRKRLSDAYGPWKSASIEALRTMQKEYSSITDANVMRLARTYGLEYAVLYRETASSLPVLYENKEFKLVSIPQG